MANMLQNRNRWQTSLYMQAGVVEAAAVEPEMGLVG